MRFSNEIALDIVSYLNKTQLKSVRLVSKQWCDCGSQYLFDQLYVSPHKEDLDVFNSVTQHPILSNCVRRLIYDGAEFQLSYTLLDYYKDIRQDWI